MWNTPTNISTIVQNTDISNQLAIGTNRSIYTPPNNNMFYLFIFLIVMAIAIYYYKYHYKNPKEYYTN